MIIKIKSRKKPSYHQLLEYILHDKDRLFNRNKESFCITHNMTGNSIDEWVEQFKTNENFRKVKRNDSIYLYHEVLSWHRDDAKEITLDKLEDMTREYLSLRNPNGMFVAAPHFDKQHYHIHIAASGIEYRTGKSLRLEKKALQELKHKIQQYQIEKYPELSKSIVNHSKSVKKVRALQSDKEFQMKIRMGRATKQEELQRILESSYKKAKYPDDFLKLLKGYGIEPYTRGGKISGINWNGKRYRLKRLGFSVEQLLKINIYVQRKNELNKVRDRKREIELIMER